MLKTEHLLALIAHDLRNPVSGILSGTEYLIEDASSSIVPEHLAVLHSIEASSRQMLAIIAELAEIASIESTNPYIDQQSGDLVRVVESVIEWHRPAAAGLSAAIELKVEPGLRRIEVGPQGVWLAIHRLLAIMVRGASTGSRIVLAVNGARDTASVSINADGGASDPVPQSKEAGSRFTIALIERIAVSQGGALKYGRETSGGPWFQLSLPLLGRGRSRRARVTGPEAASQQ